LTAGGGVLLRPWSLDDAQAVLDAYQDKAIQRWHVQPWVPRNSVCLELRIGL
jgi:hypothetical protein